MYHDMTGLLKCPFCQDGDQLHYNAIPNNATLVYRGKVDGEMAEVTERLGGVRDYHCMNCDFKFFTTIGDISDAEQATHHNTR